MKHLAGLIFFCLILTGGCEQTSSSQPDRPNGVPAAQSAPPEFSKGETLFNQSCARCHGEGAQGTNQGPPLISKIYEPGHHSDASFHLAVRNGVQAHHWKFGNMPKIAGVSEEQVNEIIKYVRWLQREAGIF
jgi:mono/diheme cytochrome c family protein